MPLDAPLSGYLRFRYVVDTDHRLHCQPHSQLKSKYERRHLILVAQFGRTILELFERLLLRLRQRLYQFILVARQ